MKVLDGDDLVTNHLGTLIQKLSETQADMVITPYIKEYKSGEKIIQNQYDVNKGRFIIIING